MEKVFSNLKLFSSMSNSYIKGMSEWFWSYMVALCLAVLMGLMLVSSLLFGGSFLLNFYIEIFALVLGVHVFMSFRAIIHDYVYNKHIVIICTNLVLLVVLSIVVEFLRS